MQRRVLFACTIIILLLTGYAWANDGDEYWVPVANISDLEQEGQDIHVFLRFRVGNYFEKPYCLSVVDKSGEERTLVDNHVFTLDEGTSWEDCWRSDDDDDSYPETDDCDGDGVDECNGHCYTRVEIEVVDVCVPPGKATYSLKLATASFNEDSDSTTVMANDLSCLPDDYNADDDDEIGDDNGDTASDDDDDDNDDGCGCSANPYAAGFPLTALMLVIGLAPLLFSRRKR